MSKYLTLLLALCCLTLTAQTAGDAFANLPVQGDYANQNAVNSAVPGKLVIDQALLTVANSLAQKPLPAKTVAVLPLRNQNPATNSGENNNYLVGRLTNILATSGYTCTVSKEDDAWNEIAKQLAWNERKDDILDNQTIVKLGQQLNAEILIYGSISQIMDYGSHLFGEVTLYAVDTKTATHVWGGTFAGRAYKGQDIQGLVSLDNDLRNLFAQAFQKAAANLQTPENLSKTAHLKNIAMLPVTGDLDQYATEMAEAMLAKLNTFTPVNISLPTIDMACRTFGHNGKPLADAVFQATLRDASKTISQDHEYIQHTPGSKDYVSCRDWTKRVEFHLSLIRATDKAVLWSTNVAAELQGQDKRLLSKEEIKNFIGDEHNRVLYILAHPFSSDASGFYKLIIFGILGLAALGVIIIFFKGIIMICFRR